MNKSILIKKLLIYPALFTSSKGGKSKTIARQLDVALMEVGFKLSKELMEHVGRMAATEAFSAANTMIVAVKELVGDHHKHNVYFKDFPKNVPDTIEFWMGLLVKHFEETGMITSNLLEFKTYGKCQHTYEEMLEAHKAFKPKGKIKLKVINLGKTEQEEFTKLFVNLAESPVPLNETDRGLLGELYENGYKTKVAVTLRENRAILNALKLDKEPLDIDTPTDLLRLAAHLSGGDVTLATPTKFKSFSRCYRRGIVASLDVLLKVNPEKIEDLNSRKEVWKRLIGRLHPFEFKAQFPNAMKAFGFALGKVEVVTWGHKVHTAIQQGKISKLIGLLAEKPGYFVRQLDKVSREANDAQFTEMLKELRECVGRVSGRVVLSLIEHMGNRGESTERLFVNTKGGGWAGEALDPLPAKKIARIQKVLWDSIEDRIPSKGSIRVGDIGGIALPISEKGKSEGFRVLPRGSVVQLDKSKDILRFFIYWHQQGERTDYDLSATMFNKDFQNIGQVSWTSLRYGDVKGSMAVHSGDITSAPSGASEFIDLRLNRIGNDVAYIIPTVNHFSGNLYKDCKECFFGFMSRDEKEVGKPFEAKTVQTRFDLRGDKGVACPMVIMRGENGWQVKWLDLYLKGLPYANRVEANKYSTAKLMKSLVNRKYLDLAQLVQIYQDKAKGGSLSKNGLYVGLERPEGIPDGCEVVTLENIKTLIPN